MADSVAKGEELFNAAQKKLKSFGFFGECHAAGDAAGRADLRATKAWRCQLAAPPRRMHGML
jgi:hypothetical protein